MNKFAAVLLLAFVAVAAADVKLVDLNDPETQSMLVPTDAEETAQLTGDMTMFADFCTKSRDYVLGDIKTNTNQLSATVFSMFYKNAEEIGTSGLEAGKEAAAKEIEAMKAGDAPIVKPDTLFQSFVNTISAAANTVSSGVVATMNGLKSAFGVARLGGALTSVCEQVATYEEKNKADFAAFAAKVAEKDASLGATPFEQVACVTSRRVSTVDGLCKLAAVAQSPVAKIYTAVH